MNEEQRPRLTAPDISLAAFVALLLFGLYMVTFDGTLHSTDGLSMMAVTENLLKHGRVDTAQLENWESATPGVDGRPYTVFPIGPTLVMLPFMAAALALPRVGLTQTGMILMPLASALTAFYVYLIIRRWGYSAKIGLLGVFLAGLGTMTWPRTRDLVADPLILVGFTATFYYALAYRQERRLGQAGLVGLALGLTILLKSVNAVTAPFFFWYLTAPRFNIFPLKKLAWRAGFTAVLPVLGAVLIIGGYNFLRFGDPLDSGFRGHLTFSTPVWMGATGLLISPYKSLFLYVPLFLLLPFALPKSWQVRPRETLLILALAASHLLIFGAWHDWGGGRNWGPRYLVPLNALLTLLLIPFIASLFHPRRRAARLVFIAVAAVSAGMQLLGLSARDYAFLGTADYWSRPPHFSYLGELTWDRPEQWPVWGHLLRFDIRDIPVIWRWQWGDLTHFDPVSLAAILLIGGLGLAGTLLLYRGRRLKRRWVGGAWLLAGGCVLLVLGRSYNDPRSIEREAEAARLWPAYSALVHRLPELVEPGEAVIFTDRRFEFYLLDLDRSPARRYVIAKPNQPVILETIPRMLEQDRPGRIWLVMDDLDNRGLAYAVELWLAAQARPLDQDRYLFGSSVLLAAYEPREGIAWPPIPPEPPLDVRVDPDDYTFNGIASLLGWRWPTLADPAPPTLRPGRAYPFALYWIYRGKAPADRFFIRLLDETGRPVAETWLSARSGRRLIDGRLFIDEAVVSIPSDLSPGTYHLQPGFSIPVVEAGELTFDLPPEATTVRVGPSSPRE